MAEEVKEEVKTFDDFIGTKEYNDHFNGLKGTWGKDYATKFETEKLPEVKKSMRDELMKELNPEESKDQKRIRELENNEKLRVEEKALNDKKAALRDKAKEIGFDISKADRYAAYGDKAEDFLIEDNDFFKTSISAAIDAKTKGTISTETPKGGTEEDSSYDYKSKMDDLAKKL